MALTCSDISIRIALEISYILLRLIFTEETYPLLYLLLDRCSRIAVRRRKTTIIAIDTSADTFGAVSIGASKTRIYRYFLYSAAKLFAQYIGVFVVHTCTIVK